MVFHGTVHAVLKRFFHKTIHACVEFFFVEQFVHGIMPLLKVFVCGAIHAPVKRVFHGSNSCSC